MKHQAAGLIVGGVWDCAVTPQTTALALPAQMIIPTKMLRGNSGAIIVL